MLFWTLRIFFIAILAIVSGLDNQKINVLFINEVGNEVAKKAIDVVREYVEKNQNLGMSVEVTTIEGNRTESKKFLEDMCEKYSEVISLNKPPHIVFDTTITGISSEAVKLFVSALGLPTVSASFGQDDDLRQWRDISDKEKKYLLHVMPPADIITGIVGEIIKYLNITNAAIFYDDNFIMDHKYKNILQNIPTRHVIKAVAEGDKWIKTRIEELRNKEINNFFILGSPQSIKMVLDSAKPEYFKRNFAWHAITLLHKDLDVPCKCDNATIMFIRPNPNNEVLDRLSLIKSTYNLKKEPEILSAFYFDLALRSFLAIRNMLIANAYPKDMNYFTCDEHNNSNVLEREIDLISYFATVSEPTTYGPFEMSARSNITTKANSYMKFTMDISAVLVKDCATKSNKILGNWTSGIDSPLNIIEKKAMKNLKATIVYRVVTAEAAPFIMRDPTAPKLFKGYCIDLIDEIAKIVKFDYEIKAVADFGNMNEQGEWNGIVKELIDKKADIGLGTLSVMAERETVIDFTIPYYDLVGIAIMMQMPSTSSAFFKFLTVLETNVWICILAAYFFTSFLMWMFDRWSPYSFQNNRTKYEDHYEKREFSLKECLWFCMTSLTPQGGGEAPTNLSGRLVAATWWLFGFIIIASYTANLAAFLTVSRLKTSIESLDDLANQFKILYAPINGSSSMTYFQRMAEIEERFYNIWKDMSLNDSLSPYERSKLAVWDYPVSDKYTKLWQAIQKAGLPNSLEEAVQRVRNSTSASGFAFLGDATDVNYHVMINCDLQIVGEEFSRKPYSIAVQQGSPLKKQFNDAILALINKRKLEELKKKWWNYEEYQSKCEQPEDQTDGISIKNIGGVFIVIVVGILLAFFTLIFEYCWYKFSKNGNVVDVDDNTIIVTNNRPQIRPKIKHPICLSSDGKEQRNDQQVLRARVGHTGGQPKTLNK